MAKAKGQKYSAEQKTKIVLEILKEEQTLSQLASKYEVTVKTLQNWKRHFLENASLAFDVASATKSYKKEIDELKVENDNLAKTLGKTIVERDWAVGKLKSLGLNEKKALIEPKLKELSISKQCSILELNRSSYYHRAKPINQENIALMHRIDEIYTDNPEYGYRFIHQHLYNLPRGNKILYDKFGEYL
jgi:putative transposase